MKKFIQLLMLFAFIGVANLAFASAPDLGADSNTSKPEDSALHHNLVGICDANNNTDLTFTITAGNTNDDFIIVAGTNPNEHCGFLRADHPLDFETTPQYTLTIHAENGDGSDDKVVTFNVTDVDEAPHGSTAHPGARDEDVAIGTTFYNINDFKTRNDTDEDGDTITYTIVGGNTNDDFAVDSATGAVTSAKELDYETTPTYHLVVEGSSTGTSGVAQTATFNVIININDVDEAPEFTSPDHVSIPENTTVVTTVQAVDPEGSTVTYSLHGGPHTDFGAFQIDANTGELNFINAPDFENPTDSGVDAATTGDNIYVAPVEVSDGTNSELRFIYVTVTDVDESRHSRKSSRISRKKTKEIFAKAKETKEELKKEVKGEQNEQKCSYTYTRMIGTHSKGEHVKQLQSILNALGFNTGKVDGIYGSKTREGIKAFQRAMGIMDDGVFGPQSYGKLTVKCSA